VFSSIRYPIRVSYTSAAGAGPGQVIVTVTTPEPAVFATGGAVAALALMARRRRVPSTLSGKLATRHTGDRRRPRRRRNAAGDRMVPSLSGKVRGHCQSSVW